LIKNCIHPKLGKKVDIGIREGKIAKIGSVDEEAELVVEAAGCLALESFVIPHLHLCMRIRLIWLVGRPLVCIGRI
jgi:dihydroorotase-like cyclic amidohydrolase